MEMVQVAALPRRGLVVGLSGKFGSGKDTAATLLQEAMPEMHWKRISFAYLVKATVATLTSTTMEANLSDAGKQTVPRGFKDTLGTLQQKVGMAMRQHIDPDVWVQAAFATIAPGDNVLVTDVRFPNEATEIRDRWGGLVIRLQGRAPRTEERRDPNHPSETALDNSPTAFNAIIENTGTLAQLRSHLVDVVRARLDNK
jgi:hypothetical protein